MKTRYMHTLSGRAATYNGYQIVYSVVTQPIKTRATLAEIKADRRASVAWRRKNGYNNSLGEYGHRRVCVEG